MASPRPSRPGKGGALLPAPGAVRRRGSPPRRTGRGLARRPRRQGLAAVELAIRTAMSKLGASLLQDLLGLDTGHRGPRVETGAGHQANFVAYRSKNLDTVLGPVTLGRAYYHCGDCGVGVVPKDNELGVTGASLSPGLRAMVARVGAATPFAKASDLLTELAGVELSTKGGGTQRGGRRAGPRRDRRRRGRRGTHRPAGPAGAGQAGSEALRRDGRHRGPY